MYCRLGFETFVSQLWILVASTPICSATLTLDQFQREAPPPEVVAQRVQLVWWPGAACEVATGGAPEPLLRWAERTGM